jgi:hypothetical protein
MKRKIIEFHSGSHPGFPVMDMLIWGNPIDVLENGLLDLVMNTKTASQVAKEFEIAMEAWRLESK